MQAVSQWRLLVSAAVALALIAPAAASAGPVDDAFAKLLGDVRAVSSAPRALGQAAVQARQDAGRGSPCRAITSLNRVRTIAAQERRRKGTASVLEATIEADSLAVAAVLLTQPGSKECGGGATPPAGGAEPEVRVSSSDVNGLQLHVSLPQAHFTARAGGGRTFTDLAMDGMGVVSGVGRPDIPASTHFFAVPPGAEVSVQVAGSSSYALNGVDLWPQQIEPADGVFDNPAFTIDSKAYSATAPYPAAPARAGALGTLRDLRVGGLEVDGAQYSPARRTLRVYTGFDVKVSFRGSKTRNFGDSRVTSLWNLGYRGVYSGLLNWAAVQANLGPITKFLTCGEENLIVTSAALRDAADTLAEARTADGIPSRVVEVGNGAGQIGTTAAAIQTYIRGELASTCFVRPSYVTLVGDTANVPTFKPASPWNGVDAQGNPWGSQFDGLIASDLGYALADNADLLPDLAVGRIPAPNLAVATTVVDKITGYEDEPPFAPAFYKNATVTSFFQCGGQGNPACNVATQDLRGFTKTSETVRNALIAKGYTVDRIYTTAAANPQTYYDGTALPAGLLKPGFPWNGSKANVTTAWNAGRFIIFHRDHGAPDGWANPTFTDGTSNAPNDLAGLTNKELLPVVFSINCASGKFDDPTAHFVEAALQLAGGGAVGVIGDSRNSPSFTNNHMALGLFDAIFPNVLPTYGSATPIKRMGDVLTAGKIYMNTQNGLDFQTNAQTQAELYLYQWFGDPTMPIWTAQPLVFLVERAVGELQLDGSVLVSLSQARTEGAVVTVFQDGQAIGRALLKGEKVQVMPDEPVDPEKGPLTVTLDQDGFEPASFDFPAEAG